MLNTKIEALSGLVARHATEEKILAEVQKCEVVCVLCHRLRTEKRTIRNAVGKQAIRRKEGLEFIRSLKDGPCLDCGKSFAPCQMDFDHRPETVKNYCVSKMTNLAHTTIFTEVAKCDLICVLCHRRRTCERNQYRNSDVKLRVAPGCGPKLLVEKSDIDDLVSLYSSGCSLVELAARFNVSQPVVRARLESQGVKIRGVSEAKTVCYGAIVLDVVSKYKEGLSAAKIGNQYNVSDSIVYKILDNANIDRRKQKGKGRSIVDGRGVVYKSQQDAAKALGLFDTQVSAVLNGRLKTIKGNTFRYCEAP